MLVGASRSICLLCRQPLSDGFANPTYWSFARSGRPPAQPVVSWAPAAGHTRVPTRPRRNRASPRIIRPHMPRSLVTRFALGLAALLAVSNPPVSAQATQKSDTSTAPAKQSAKAKTPAKTPSDSTADTSAVASIDSLSWLGIRNVGPTVAGGRVAAVIGVPGDPNVYYVGAGGGGV